MKKNIRKISLQDFRVMLKKEVAHEILLDLNSWFDLWHTHVDSEIYGKLSRLHRQVELRALFCILQKIERLCKSNRSRYQIFACIYENDSGSDAVYIHTENPNGTAFPYDLNINKNLEKLPFWLAHHIELSDYQAGEASYEGEKYYIIQRRQVIEN